MIHRREILRLAELDERGLKDIGLVRSDIDGALATSWLKDPSAILAARSSVAEQRRLGPARGRSSTGDGERPVAQPGCGRPADDTVACNA